MRLSSSWVFAAGAAASTSMITLPTTFGFQQQQQQQQRQLRQRAPSSSSSSSMRVSATMYESATSTTSDEASTTTMTYADVNSLAFRALQRECKSLGLSAVGTTAALRGRLLGHYGLERVVEAADVATLAATAAEIEVSLSLRRRLER